MNGWVSYVSNAPGPDTPNIEDSEFAAEHRNHCTTELIADITKNNINNNGEGNLDIDDNNDKYNDDDVDIVNDDNGNSDDNSDN